MSFVLVTGCPRSGTTAFARWLLSTPGVSGGSETRITVAAHAFIEQVRRFAVLDARPKILEEIKALVMRSYEPGIVVVDKEPLEPIAFPDHDHGRYLDDVVDVLGARLVFMVRNPVATVWSMLAMAWGTSLAAPTMLKYDVGKCVTIWRRAARQALSNFARGRADLFSHESLASDPEGVRQRVHEILGISARPFPPRPTKKVSFPPEVSKKIQDETAWERGLLGYSGGVEQKARICLLTGPPGSGKTTVSKLVAEKLGGGTVVIDGDDLRKHLWPTLGFTEPDRQQSMSRAMKLAVHATSHRSHVIVAMVAPYEQGRAAMAALAYRHMVPFDVVHLDAPDAVLRERRPPSYGFKEISYEPPKEAMKIRTDLESTATSAAKVARLFTA